MVSFIFTLWVADFTASTSGRLVFRFCDWFRISDSGDYQKRCVGFRQTLEGRRPVRPGAQRAPLQRGNCCCGFTLLELLVVMLIIAILAGLGTGAYRLARRSAKESQAKAEIEVLRTALEEYRVEYGGYPYDFGPHFEDMFSGLTDSQRECLQQGIDADLQMEDPWGNPYQYFSTNRYIYRVWSHGADTNTTADNIDPIGIGY